MLRILLVLLVLFLLVLVLLFVVLLLVLLVLFLVLILLVLLLVFQLLLRQCQVVAGFIVLRIVAQGFLIGFDTLRQLFGRLQDNAHIMVNLCQLHLVLFNL